MIFPPQAYLAALFGAIFTTLITLPLWRRWCLRAGLVDDPGHRKIHDAPVPLAGGLAVLTGLAAPLAAGVIAVKFQLLGIHTTELLSYGLSRRALELISILFGALGMVTLGCWDDKHELRPAMKFAGQCLIAVAVAAAGVRITLFVHSTPFSYLITILWILTVTNAFNFMDNMNGLCAGLGAIAASVFALIAAGDGQYLVALIAFVSAGALLGFLPYNYPRATAFLGDSGGNSSLEIRPAVLRGRHQPSLPPPGPPRLEPPRRGAVHLAAGRADGWVGFFVNLQLVQKLLFVTWAGGLQYALGNRHAL